MLVAVLALAACGGGSTPAASSEPGRHAGRGSHGRTRGDQRRRGHRPAPAAGGAVNLGDAAASLENLDNYSFKIEMTAEGGSKGMMGMVASGGSIVMEGALQLKPVEAADITMTLGDGSQSTEIGYRIIGDKAYMNLGGDSWMAAPADDAAAAIDSLKPDKLLKGYATCRHEQGRRGGQERDPERPLPVDRGPGRRQHARAADGDLDDRHVACQGRRVPRLRRRSSPRARTTPARPARSRCRVDVTGVNDPNLKIEAPANVQEMPG